MHHTHHQNDTTLDKPIEKNVSSPHRDRGNPCLGNRLHILPSVRSDKASDDKIQLLLNTCGKNMTVGMATSCCRWRRYVPVRLTGLLRWEIQPELFRVIEVHAVGHGRAGVRRSCLLVGDAGLSCLRVERQDGVVFYEGYEPLRLPGAPNYQQQHYGCENLHVDAPGAVE